MVPKYTITAFHEVDIPIIQPVTKFGGQPVWVAAPQWPLSRSTRLPMRFICQIALDEPIFGNLAGRMAYVFLTDNEEPDPFVDSTYDPDGGENAVIIQPDGEYDGAVRPSATGPALVKVVWDDPPRPGQPGRFAPIELAVDLALEQDPDVLDEDQARAEGQAALDAYWDHVSDDKVGGTPAFLQYPEYPLGRDARLLLQLNEPEDGAFSINLGITGVAYAFIATDGRSGKLLWQCA